MRLTVVGCSGSYPGPDAACSAYLVEHDGFRLLLDLGNGALGALQRHADPRGIDVAFLSHLHGDHWLDLVPLAYMRGHNPDGRVPRPLPVIAPAGERARVAAVLGRPELAMAASFAFDEPRDGEIGPFAVRVIRTAHPVETYAIRLSVAGATLVYTADTGPLPGLADFAADADLLLAEAGFAQTGDNPPDLHLTPGEAGALARQAGAGRLVVTHVPPWFDTRVQHEIAAEAFGGPTDLARPGRSFEL